MKKLLRLLFIIITFNSIAQVPGFNYGKQIIISSSEITGTSNLLNFPILISITDPDLRFLGNGGKINSPNGYDLVFTSNDCTTILDYDIENYNPVTGVLNVWVKIPSLPSLTNYEIYMYYGNPSISTSLSTTNTWSSGYDGVWHLHNDFLDYSGFGNNGTNFGSINASPSIIGDCRRFVSPNNWITLNNHPNRTGSFSYSGWFRTNNNTRAGQRIICDDESNANGSYAVSLGDPGTGRLRFYIRGLNPVSLDTPNLISNGIWYHFTATYNVVTGVKRLFINGSEVANQITTGTLVANLGNASIGGETNLSGEPNNRFSGDIDEIRSFPGVLTPEWIQTEYNNQSNPSTFYSISSEYPATDLCLVLPIELISFNVTSEDNRFVNLNWSTASETNNSHFVVEKSLNGEEWKEVLKMDGAGNSTVTQYYFNTDYYPYLGISYYRLKQVDFNGKFSYSSIQSVSISNNDSDETSLYPNPTKNIVNLKGKAEELKNIHITNLIGEDISSQVTINKHSDILFSIDLSKLSAGGYLIRTSTRGYQVYKQ